MGSLAQWSPMTPDGEQKPRIEIESIIESKKRANTHWLKGFKNQ